MPRHDEWKRRQEAAGTADASETHDDSGTEPAGQHEATEPALTDEDLWAELEAELAGKGSLTSPLDSDVPTAVGAAQSESNPMSLVDSSEFNWVVRFYVSVLGEHKAVTAGLVAFLGVVITAIPLMASLPTSTSWAFVGVGMFLTWVVALRLARWAD